MTFPYVTYNPGGFLLTYEGYSDSSPSGVSSFDYGVMSLGSRNSRKRTYIIVSWGITGTATVTGITVGGNAATLLKRATASASKSGVDIYYYDTTAKTGDIIVTWSGSISGGAKVMVYAAYNLTSGAVYSTDAYQSTSTVSSVSNTVNTTPGTFVLTCAREANANTMVLTNAIEDPNAGSSNRWDCVGHDTNPPTATGRVISCAFGASSNNSAMATVVIYK